MDDDKKITEAELQMERLRRLKEKKDLNVKKSEEDNFAPVKTVKPDLKKALRPKRLKIEKRIFNRIYRIVKDINKAGKSTGLHVSVDKFINIILKRVLDLGLDYKMAVDRDAIERLLAKLKKEE